MELDPNPRHADSVKAKRQKAKGKRQKERKQLESLSCRKQEGRWWWIGGLQLAPEVWVWPSLKLKVTGIVGYMREAHEA